jgi:hypothetical protein
MKKYLNMKSIIGIADKGLQKGKEMIQSSTTIKKIEGKNELMSKIFTKVKDSKISASEFLSDAKANI